MIQGRGGVLPYLTRLDVLLNRVSSCGKNYATGWHFQKKIVRHGIIIDKKICDKVIIERNTLNATINHAYFWQDFYATGYIFGAFFMRQSTTCAEAFHTPP